MEVQMSINIPLGQPDVVLSPDPDDSARQALETLSAFQAGKIDRSACQEQLRALAARYPTSLSTWATLGEISLPHDVITAYAFFRTGYHRGLDRARASGWNGSQPLPWEHENNQGFLRCLYGLMCAATEIGEAAEATRTRNFLRDLDTSDHFAVGNA
jgi:hypothetical protein